ncbi:MAG: hypothetical protein GKS00_06505 [Alphaproteobacteria bacterium]|nr:hypothetical protein [Alphaproteobacteria bacterium]
MIPTTIEEQIEELIKKQENTEQIEIRYPQIIAEVRDFVGLFENLCQYGAHTHPITADLVATVVEIGWDVVQYYKEIFARRRPSVINPYVRPLIRVPRFAAYPSGHATQAHLVKEILKEILSCVMGDEERFVIEQRLDETAERIGVNREYAGVHYASDTHSGMCLAHDIWQVASKNPTFIRFIKAAQEEWARSEQSGLSIIVR